MPINRLRRSVKEFVGETSANVSTLVAKGNAFLQSLFGKKKKEKTKPKTSTNHPNRPHQRKAKVAPGTAYVKKKEKVNWYEGWGSGTTGQQIIDNATRR